MIRNLVKALLVRFLDFRMDWNGIPLYSQSDFDAMRAQRDEARDEIKRLTRMLTDSTYMLAAHRNMLGENGLKVVAM